MQPEDKQEFTQPVESTYTPSVQEGESSDPTVAQSVPVEELDETLDMGDESSETQQSLRWQASEYIQEAKGPLWYILLAFVTVALMAGAIFLMQSPTFAILIPVMAVALVVYVRRPPAAISYTLSGKGLFINDTLHSIHEFKSFGVIHDGQEYSIQLIPVRRFRPSLSVYFPEDVGEKIVDMLGVRLPMEQLKPDAFDKIAKFLRI